MMDVKKCTLCEVEKPLKEFYLRVKYGCPPRCKVCEDWRKTRERDKREGKETKFTNMSREDYEGYRQEKQRLIDNNLKVCNKCKVEKPIDMFDRKSTARSQTGVMYREYQCKSCRAFWKAGRKHKRRFSHQTMVSKEEFMKVYEGECECCSESPNMAVDRIDSAKGYTKDNIQSLCAVCNRLKYTLSNKDFHFHVRRIVKNQLRLTKVSRNGKKVKQEQTLFPI